MPVTYSTDSNLRNTPIESSILGSELGLYVPPVDVVPSRTRTMTLDQRYHKRPDLLAYNLYGNSDFWWIFILYNRDIIVDPINDFVQGLTIRVPNSDLVG